MMHSLRWASVGVFLDHRANDEWFGATNPPVRSVQTSRSQWSKSLQYYLAFHFIL